MKYLKQNYSKHTVLTLPETTSYSAPDLLPNLQWGPAVSDPELLVHQADTYPPTKIFQQVIAKDKTGTDINYIIKINQ